MRQDERLESNDEVGFIKIKFMKCNAAKQKLCCQIALYFYDMKNGLQKEKDFIHRIEKKP